MVTPKKHPNGINRHAKNTIRPYADKLHMASHVKTAIEQERKVVLWVPASKVTVPLTKIAAIRLLPHCRNEHGYLQDIYGENMVTLDTKESTVTIRI